jgi:ligand-binding SRPBCC domain-containing protein
MKVYSLVRSQIIPAGLNDVWDFFSSPANLSVITPARMNFRIVHNSHEQGMAEGQIIRYTINVVPFLTTAWTTRITHVDKPNSFIDVQEKGPYALWEHHHHFKQVSDGILMTDEVRYAIPYGWIGRLANSVFVEREVNAIFEFRSQAVTNYFLNRKHL